MTDEPMAPVLRSWMRDTDRTAPDARHSADQVIARVEQTQQLGRWWWLPSFRRTQASAPSATDTSEFQPSPVPATNGHNPTVRRTTSMLSPVKAITAGAIIFAIGGALVVAQPFEQQGSVPGAATAPAEPVPFTASLRPGNDVGTTTLTEVGGRVERRGTVWAPSLTASDPRLEGDVRLSIPQDQYPGYTFRTDTWRIENAEGAWQGTTVIFEASGTGSGGTVVLAGEGAYEGLYAALDVSDPRDMRGVIFPAPPPDALHPASAP